MLLSSVTESQLLVRAPSHVSEGQLETDQGPKSGRRPREIRNGRRFAETQPLNRVVRQQFLRATFKGSAPEMQHNCPVRKAQPERHVLFGK